MTSIILEVTIVKKLQEGNIVSVGINKYLNKDRPWVGSSIMTFLKKLWRQRALLYFFLVPVALLPIALVDPQPKWQCAYVVALMACYWLPQVIPIAVTSLLPLILFPVLGIMTSRDTAKNYMNDTALVFWGGMVVAIALEVWNVHKRIALRIVLCMGSNPRWILLGLMLSTWLLSMWISNTATTAMMVPIARAIVGQLSHHEDNEEPLQGDNEEKATMTRSRNRRSDHRQQKRMSKGLIVSIAYAANIGGLATLTGTPSNIILKGQIDQLYTDCKDQSPVSFGLWMASSLPLSILLLLLAWVWLQIFFLPRTCRIDGCRKHGTGSTDHVKAEITAQYNSLGPVTFAEFSVLAMFLLLIVLWVSRDLGGVGGWGWLFPGYVSDATSVIVVSVLLFILPSKNPFGPLSTVDNQTALLTWQQLNCKMPWTLILLLGGGFSLAKGCEASGLSEWVGEKLESLSHLNPTLTLLIVCYVVTTATEVTSNVAITTLLLPVLSQLALVTQVNPFKYMYPATLSASLAFLLPVATPPNAIVFASGHIRVIDMVLAGLILNILAVPIVVMATVTWGTVLFNLDVFPDCFTNVTLGNNASITV